MTSEPVAYILTGDCQSCGEPFDRRDNGFDCPCQRNGHKTDACITGKEDCLCGPRVVTKAQIDRILAATGPRPDADLPGTVAAESDVDK